MRCKVTNKVCLTGKDYFTEFCKHSGMVNAKFKFIVSQARIINLYRNTRSKLLKCNVNIYFNKQCIARKVIQKYANLKFTKNSPVAQVTASKAQILRVKNEIKFLFKRKDKPNHELYTIHMKAVNEWGSLWPSIQDSIHENLSQAIEKEYQSLDKKIRKLKGVSDL